MFRVHLRLLSLENNVYRLNICANKKSLQDVINVIQTKTAVLVVVSVWVNVVYHGVLQKVNHSYMNIQYLPLSWYHLLVVHHSEMFNRKFR